MEELRDRNELKVFVVDKDTGVVTTNVYFSDSMQGYFEIKLFVNDSIAGHNDTAEASVRNYYHLIMWSYDVSNKKEETSKEILGLVYLILDSFLAF